MKLRVHPGAGEDLRSTVAWFEEHAPGSSAVVVERIDSTLRLLTQFPMLGARNPRDARVRRIVVRQTSYKLIYLPRDDEIVVVAIAHARRHPDFWKARLDDTDAV